MRIRDDESGQVLILAALCMVILLGFVALAVDVGLLYRQRRLAQTAADAGALAAAAQISVYPNGTAPARAAATQNGLTLGTVKGQATVTATILPASSTLGFVRVTVTEHTPTIFMGVMGSGFSMMNVSATEGPPTVFKATTNACSD